jgi:hypothetical protein
VPWDGHCRSPQFRMQIGLTHLRSLNSVTLINGFYDKPLIRAPLLSVLRFREGKAPDLRVIRLCGGVFLEAEFTASFFPEMKRAC